jgi:hypothetical protein
MLWTDTNLPVSGVYINTTYRLAQGFTPSVTGNLTSVSLAIARIDANTDLIIEIYATSGGKPTGSPLATQTIPKGNVPAAGTYGNTKLLVTFSSPAALTSGTVYAIVASSTCALYGYLWWGTTHTIYTAGTLYWSNNSGSTWFSASPKSCAFVTTMDVPVATPGLDQWIFGSRAGNPAEYQVALAGAYRAQTFIPSVAGQLKKIRFWLTKVDGQTTGTTDVVIYAVDGSHKPVGSALATQSLVDTAIPTDAASTPVDVTFTTPATLLAGTEYAIVLQFNNVDATHRYNLGNDYTVDEYALGQRWDSSNSGSTWSSNANSKDLLFGTFMFELNTAFITIGSNAAIKSTAELTIQSSAFCGETNEQTIDSDSYILSPQISIDSNANIILVSEHTISSGAHIKTTTGKTINSQASICIEASQTIESSAMIFKIEPVLTLYVVI